MNIIPYEQRVGADTEEIFGDNFYVNLIVFVLYLHCFWMMLMLRLTCIKDVPSTTFLCLNLYYYGTKGDTQMVVVLRIPN